MPNKITEYFLGANSPSGFYSLYGGFVNTMQKDTLYIIKGGPGCGKSSFMKRVAEGLSKNGSSVEYIRCSGDPDSIDGVYFPELHLAYVDGTAPHIIEPRFPGAAERYLNLGVYYDAAALSRMRDDIAAAFIAYKKLYARAYSLISASDAATSGMYLPLITDAVSAKAVSRAQGIVSREIRGTGRGGSVKKRFLSALTCRGRITLFETADALCERICTIDNEYGLAPVFLSPIADAAAAKGFDTVVCPDPMHPDRLSHVFIPELSLGFVSQTPGEKYSGSPYRHIRLDALIDAETERAIRPRLRTCTKLAAGLEKEAVSALAEAKTLHDELERIYNPHVDFDGVYALAKAHIAQYS